MVAAVVQNYYRPAAPASHYHGFDTAARKPVARPAPAASKQPPLLACGGTYANTSDVPVYQDVQGSTTYYPPIFADAPAELAAQLPPPAYGDSSACTSDARVYQDAQGRTT